MIADIVRVWSLSKALYASGVADTARRCTFVAKSVAFSSDLQGLLRASERTVAGRLLRDRPEVIGILVWPYQCASWDASTRLRRLNKHCETVANLGKPFDLGANDRIVLADLTSIREGLRVVLDQPKWFMREGNLVVNLFVHRVRMYSLAFSVYEEDEGVTAIIGAIQGRDLVGALDEYRNLTKLLHGMRPRDFLFELFSMICSEVSINRVLAVTNEARHHAHPYFGSGFVKPSTNYNQIWEERGAARIDNSFYLLDASQRKKELAAIPAKKRGMYRRRYELLDEIRGKMQETIQKSKSSPIFESHERLDQ